jgi:hypothetical protein
MTFRGLWDACWSGYSMKRCRFPQPFYEDAKVAMDDMTEYRSDLGKHISELM